MAHLIYLAYGFPPAAKSGSFRARAVANSFAARGWDVTAVSLADRSWDREHGTDPSLLEGLHPRIRRFGLDVSRRDLEPDLRLWSEDRLSDPGGWRDRFREESQQAFPEAVFGEWHDAYLEAMERLHAEHPADLVIASPNPYVTLAAARHLHRVAGVPYVVDYRDAWSLDVVGGEEAFAPTSRAGRIEQDVLEHAHEVWFVNNPIREWHAQRYPAAAERFHVVRNGFDPELMREVHHRDQAEPPVRFGFLGTMSISVDHLTALLEGWELARSRSPLLEGATLTFRGHIGAGYAAGSSRHALLIGERAHLGVSYGGRVSKAEVADVYSAWDALLLALVGGRFVTSGKVYEYLATGLPIMSAHATEHAATEVLEGYPLWVPPTSLQPEDLAASFEQAALLATSATREQRHAAVEHARRFSRPQQIEPALDRLLGSLPHVSPATPEPTSGPSAAEPPRPAAPPTQVLLLAARPLVPAALEPALAALRAGGHEVRIATLSEGRAALPGVEVEMRRLRGQATGQRVRRLSRTWLKRQWRNRVTLQLARRLKTPQKVWFLLRKDPVAYGWATRAGMVVALDQQAAYAASRIAQQQPATQAVLGLTEARIRLLGARP